LLLVLRTSTDEFRTGWFLESVMTELWIMLVIRTQRPFFKSMPGRPLLIGTIIVAGITLILPYSPLNKLLGFVPLSVSLVLALAGLTLLYIIASELAKRVFYKHVRL
jgi:Mg2+-importing ATPase